jgi:hypothetical protein
MSSWKRIFGQKDEALSNKNVRSDIQNTRVTQSQHLTGKTSTDVDAIKSEVKNI